jgi:hypothetical protein
MGRVAARRTKCIAVARTLASLQAYDDLTGDGDTRRARRRRMSRRH